MEKGWMQENENKKEEEDKKGEERLTKWQRSRRH
jgi:hypothetical protein